MKNHNDLRVWRESMALAEMVYRVTVRFPRHELFGLTAQLRRAAVSVPSNIAEGQGRISAGEWLQFLGQARGSLYELNTQISLAHNLEYVTADDSRLLAKQAEGVGKALSGLIDYVRRRAHPRKP